ncbi:p5 [Pineapple mealybug wilt-associated virus 6]|nr:p5 [Pineapple mealybug wilt-associated virus 6]WCR39361.1 p5 [Pineapple mealybug wilt-associated virus 6]WCR39372.1 p5 [Pineapple mealybug wilt-associated virus 6]WCR39383.1 p5 [Pineapple mealybug wilt-associated virus 6]
MQDFEETVVVLVVDFIFVLLLLIVVSWVVPRLQAAALPFYGSRVV